MNYLDFYKRSIEELKSTFLYLHAKGDKSYREHMEDMLNAEPLVRKPIFQSIFPWESDNNDMQSLSGLLGNDLINALDGATFQDPLVTNAPIEDQSFPKDRHPFKHQVKAWTEAIVNNKSILVTTGTGSGKTECFMIPILKELYDCRRQASLTGSNIGIQAIFLYPLNALIASQRKRVHAWVSRFPQQITYCNYNGELKDKERDAATRRAAYPQLIDRDTLRATPPQILFTNPSMLEYMMVRTADQNLRNNSDLRWIVLDEAHCYNGSSATELAMQIKRILKFFGKTPQDVKFAITSATISRDPAKKVQMQKFIEDLTGKVWNNEFVEIDGVRVVEQLDYTNPNTTNCIGDINTKYGTSITPSILDDLRNKLNTEPALSLDEIASTVGFSSMATTEEKISLVDALSTKTANPATTVAGILPAADTALLPTRAHFLVRSIKGVYACTNPNCTKHNAYRPMSLGRLTTYQSTLCPDCGGQMLEVVRCSQCHELLLQGIRIAASVPGTPDNYKSLQIDFKEDLLVDIASDDVSIPADAFLIDSAVRIQQPPLPANMIVSPMPKMHLDSISKEINPSTGINDYVECIKGQDKICPNCGERHSDMKPITLMPNIIQTHLATILLQQNQSIPTITQDTVYNGKKYISFTDNRQKTAQTARIQNIDTERKWIRGAIYHFLVDNSQVAPNGMSASLVKQQLQLFIGQNNSAFAPTIIDYKNQLAQTGLKSAEDFRQQHNREDQLKKLHGRFDTPAFNLDNYLLAVILDQMGTRSLRTATSLETLGLVHWVYPSIDSISTAPQSFVSFYGFSANNDVVAINEWKNLLKILLDVTIRGGRHLIIPNNVDKVLPHSFGGNPIYALGTQGQTNTWIQFDKNANTYRREFVLMLLAKGITDRASITTAIESEVNLILNDAWQELTTRNILTQSGGTNGYGLDIFANSPAVKMKLQDEGVMCPVTKQILDVTFMGLSPMLKGELCLETKVRYSINSPMSSIPTPSFSRSDAKYKAGGTFDENLWRTDVENWLNHSFVPGMNPIWGDMNSQVSIIKFDNIYLAREHSAQLDSSQLRQSERDFIDGKLNILDCSTTMEMGVDIGGLTVVTMNNVPPKPQNYQQRVGRAGRRGEQKALAMTIYSDDPIGRSVENNLKWALDHDIEPSSLSFTSENIVYRHVCATLFAEYLSVKNISLKDYLGDFIMGVDQNGIPANYSYNDYISFLNLLSNGTHPRLATIQSECVDIVLGTCLQNTTFRDMVSYAGTGITNIYNRVYNYITGINAQIAAATNTKYRSKLEITKNNLWRKNLYTYLGSKDYLPNAYMPTDLTEFILQGTNSFRTVSNPQRETHLAISEYAPGKEVVVNEMVYKSIGIAMQTLNGNIIEEQIAKCNCGYVTKQLSNSASCPNCGRRLSSILPGQNSDSTTGIEPISFYSGEPTRHHGSSSRIVNKIQPALLDALSWGTNITGQSYFVKPTFGERSVLYVNRGAGRGFALCPWCGRMEPEESIAGAGNGSLPRLFSSRSHTRPDTGQSCTNRNIQRNIVLTSEIKTNLTEIRIIDHRPMTSEERLSLLNSLGTIMSRKFAEMIGVEDGEIDFGMTDEHTIFIFDTHCGGSCYSNQLGSQNLLERLFDVCRNYLNACTCSKACTNCLIDRRSQYKIEDLDRNIAIEWLDWEYSHRNIIPSQLSALFPNSAITKITSSIEDYLSILMHSGSFVWAKYFFDSINVESADIFSLIKREMQIAKLNMGKDISLIINCANQNNYTLQTLCDLQDNAGVFDESSASWTAINGLQPILITDQCLYIKYNDNGQDGYYAIDNYNNMFAITNIVRFNPVTYLANKGCNSNRVFTSIHMNQYLEKVIGSGIANLTNYLNSQSASGSSVDIEYTDIYISTPAACIVLCNIVKQIIDKYNLTISSFTVNTGQAFRIHPISTLLGDDFADENARNTFLRNCATDILGINVQINSTGYLQHDRLLTVRDVSNTFAFEIEPNGGFDHGWKLEDDNTHAEANTTYPMDYNYYMFNKKRNVGIKFTYSWGL